MPFTPFHIVAGTSFKSIFPKYFSWSTFALTNILIDCEALYYYFTTGVLSHKFFHTIIGVSIVAIICATLGKPICELGLRIWNKNFKMEKIKWLKTDIKINKISSWSGALIGAYSQLIFDSIMHHQTKITIMVITIKHKCFCLIEDQKSPNHHTFLLKIGIFVFLLILH